MSSEKQVVLSDQLVPGKKLSWHEAVFRKHFKPLTVYATKLLGNRQDAEDVVQDVFFQLWKNSVEQTTDDMTPYLFVAVKNGCLKKVRHLKVVDKYQGTLKTHNYINDNPLHYMMLKEVEDCIEETLGSVPERTRSIFLLSRFESKKHKEIAEKLEISIKTVEAHITKVLSVLKEKLNHHTS